MKRSTSRTSLTTSFILAVAVSFVWACTVTNEKPPLSGKDKQTAIDSTLKWGRLAAFPATAKELVVTTEGNMFTRSFRLSFSASRYEIARWVIESDGLRQTRPKIEGSLRKYDIKPGCGAQHAEVVIDDSNNRVRVYVAWS